MEHKKEADIINEYLIIPINNVVWLYHLVPNEKTWLNFVKFCQ